MKDVFIFPVATAMSGINYSITVGQDNHHVRLNNFTVGDLLKSIRNTKLIENRTLQWRILMPRDKIARWREYAADLSNVQFIDMDNPQDFITVLYCIVSHATDREYLFNNSVNADNIDDYYEKRSKQQEPDCADVVYAVVDAHNVIGNAYKSVIKMLEGALEPMRKVGLYMFLTESGPVKGTDGAIVNAKVLKQFTEVLNVRNESSRVTISVSIHK